MLPHAVPTRPRPAARRLAALVTLGALLGAARPAAATFPVLLSARALSPGATDGYVAGGYGNTDADYWTALAGVRHGFLRSIEVGARAGVISVQAADGRDLAAVGGADVKIQVLRESIDIPVDFAVDVGWTVARPHGDTWSDLAFTALFGKRIRTDWLENLIGDRVSAAVGAQVVFLGGSARPGRDESASYGIAAVEVALPGDLAIIPEAKFGSHTVLGLSLRYRF